MHGNPQICRLTDQRQITAAVSLATYDEYFGWPVGGQLGLKTMFCEQGGVARCPNWVTYSILNPGKSNPYSNRVGADVTTQGLITAQLEDEQADLSPSLQSEQFEIMNSDEIQELSNELAESRLIHLSTSSAKRSVVTGVTS